MTSINYDHENAYDLSRHALHGCDNIHQQGSLFLAAQYPPTVSQLAYQLQFYGFHRKESPYLKFQKRVQDYGSM